MASEPNGRPVARPKKFSYSTSVEWIHGRIGTVTSAEREGIDFSSPPEFKGTPGLWTPEDMFVASVEMCLLLTFVALAMKRGIGIHFYTSEAKGTLEFVEGSYRFTEVEVTPTIVASDPVTPEEVSALLDEAHRQCLISNSISAIVRVQPIVRIEESVQNPA